MTVVLYVICRAETATVVDYVASVGLVLEQ